MSAAAVGHTCPPLDVLSESWRCGEPYGADWFRYYREPTQPRCERHFGGTVATQRV